MGNCEIRYSGYPWCVDCYGPFFCMISFMNFGAPEDSRNLVFRAFQSFKSDSGYSIKHTLFSYNFSNFSKSCFTILSLYIRATLKSSSPNYLFWEMILLSYFTFKFKNINMLCFLAAKIAPFFPPPIAIVANSGYAAGRCFTGEKILSSFVTDNR